MCPRSTSRRFSVWCRPSVRASLSSLPRRASLWAGPRSSAARFGRRLSCGLGSKARAGVSEPGQVEVLFTSEFKRSLRRLLKRYRSIRRDVESLVEELASGETPGERVKGTGHVVYKVRVANTDARRGKSGGYRVVYYVQTSERVILVTVYSKSDQGDISSAVLRQIIEEESPSVRSG